MNDAKLSAVETAVAALMGLVSSITIGANVEAVETDIRACVAHMYSSNSWTNRILATQMMGAKLEVVRVGMEGLEWAGLNVEMTDAYNRFVSALLDVVGPALPHIDDSPVVTIDGVTQSERQHIRDSLLIDYRKDILYGEMTYRDIDVLMEMQYQELKEQHIDQMWAVFYGR